jgi:hypothetical protein
MRVSRSNRQTAVFVLKWTDIEKIVSSISQHLPTVTVSAACSDRLDRTFSDLKELKSFRNAERSAITELQIVARDKDHSQRFAFTLNSDDRNNARLSLDAEEAVAVQLNDRYEDFLTAARPWYSWVARTNWYLVVTVIWIAIQLGRLAITIFKAKSLSFQWPKEGIPGSVLAQSLLIGMLPVFIGALINRVRRKYFPTGTFAFGDGENRHARAETVRTVLIAAFGVSLLSSIVVSWFQ